MNKKLQKIYDQIPRINCKGLCHDACTVIGASPIERKRIVERLNFDPFFSQSNITKCSEERIKCPMLDANNRCTVYDIRPFICRLYGSAKGLECRHGCKPDKYISQIEAAKILTQIEEIK